MPRRCRNGRELSYTGSFDRPRSSKEKRTSLRSAAFPRPTTPEVGRKPLQLSGLCEGRVELPPSARRRSRAGVFALEGVLYIARASMDEVEPEKRREETMNEEKARVSSS